MINGESLPLETVNGFLGKWAIPSQAIVMQQILYALPMELPSSMKNNRTLNYINKVCAAIKMLFSRITKQVQCRRSQVIVMSKSLDGLRGMLHLTSIFPSFQLISMIVFLLTRAARLQIVRHIIAALQILQRTLNT